MELIVNGETLSEPVTKALIDESIHSLTGDGDSFAILASAPQVYIQTAGGAKDGFVLEYRDGSEAEHYSSKNAGHSADEVIRAFQSYLASDNHWKTGIEWEQASFGQAPGSGGINAGWVLVGIVVLALALWKIVTS